VLAIDAFLIIFAKTMVSI